MKRIPREPFKFDAFDLFAKHVQGVSGNLRDPDVLKGFLDRLKGSIEKQLSVDSFLHGQRTQSLFETVVAGLGRVKLIKREDEGDLFYSLPDEIRPPDFRLLLEDDRQILVEVKSEFQDEPTDPQVFTKKYLETLIGYRKAMGTELFFGTYWGKWNQWTLVREEDLVLRGEKYVLPYFDALKRSQMALVGDRMIGIRSPLRFRIEAAAISKSEDKTEQQLLIKSVHLLSENTVLKDSLEIRIASFLAFYGDWEEKEPLLETDGDGGITAVEYPIAPRDDTSMQDERGFDFIGALSSMLCRQHFSQTVDEGEIVGVRAAFEPGRVGHMIPHGYHMQQHDLKLWVFTQAPT